MVVTFKAQPVVSSATRSPTYLELVRLELVTSTRTKGVKLPSVLLAVVLLPPLLLLLLWRRRFVTRAACTTIVPCGVGCDAATLGCLTLTCGMATKEE